MGGGDDEVRSFSDDERLDPEAMVTNRSLDGLEAADTKAFVAVVASLGEQMELSFDDEVTPFWVARGVPLWPLGDTVGGPEQLETGGVLKSSDGVDSVLSAQNGLLLIAALSIGGRLVELPSLPFPLLLVVLPWLTRTGPEDDFVESLLDLR